MVKLTPGALKGLIKKQTSPSKSKELTIPKKSDYLGALRGGSSLPEDINNLPSFKEAIRGFKKSLIKSEADEQTVKSMSDKEVDNEPISSLASGMNIDKDIFNNTELLQDWASGKIDYQDFQKTNEQGFMEYPFDETTTEPFGTDFLKGANYPIDPRAYVLRDLEQNYKMSKPKIIEYLKKNNIVKDINPKETFNKLQADAIKEAFASGDPNNPIVKKVTGALSNVGDELIPVEDILTTEDIYGKSN